MVLNIALTDLSTFTSLTTLGGDLHIEGNDLLASVSGFGVVGSFGGSVTVSDNDVLATCCNLLPIVDLVAGPGATTTISDNAAGCVE